MAPEPSTATTRRVGLGLSGLVFGLYLLALCPNIYFRDAGELTASAFGLGVAHPTGFPAYLLLGRLACFIPLGNIGFRLNVLSALCAAAALYVVYSILVRLAPRRSPAVLGAAAGSALVLALGDTLVLHATTAEVYLPNLLLVLLLVHRLLVALEAGDRRPLRVAAVLTGLAAGFHASTALVAAMGWSLIAFRWRGPRRVVELGLLGATGASVLAYLPIRAFTDPWRLWGDPTSLDGLIAHVTGRSIRSSFAGDMGSGGRLDVHLETALTQLGGQVSWLALVAIIGVPLLRKNGALILVTGLFVADLAFTTLLNPMGMDDRQTGVIATAASVLAAGQAFVALGPVLSRELRLTAAPIAFAFPVLLASPAMLDGMLNGEHRRLQHAVDLGDQVLDRARPAALVLVSSDDLASAATYLQGVEDARPDVAVVVKQHLGDPIGLAHTERHVIRFGSTLHTAVAARAPPGELLQALLVDVASQRPIDYELGDHVQDERVRAEFQGDLPVGHLGGPPHPDWVDMLVTSRFRWAVLANGPLPRAAAEALAVRHSLLGAHEARIGHLKRALFLAGEAYLLRRENAQVAANYALVLETRGEIDLAENRLEQVVRLRPAYALGWFNLGVLKFKKDDRPATAEAFTEAARLGAGPRRAVRMGLYLGMLEARHGDPALAALLLARVRPWLEGVAAVEADAALGTLAGAR